jgi:hypothetical protein
VPSLIQISFLTFLLVCQEETRTPGQDEKVSSIALPIDGITSHCCEVAAQQALAKLPHVTELRFQKKDGKYFALFVMEKGRGLRLSDLRRVLETVRHKGEDHVATYKISEDLVALSDVHFIRTKDEPSESTLKEHLGKLPGFKSAATCKIGFFSIVVSDKSRASLADVRRECGLEVTDVFFAPSKEGQRYFCLMHPDNASAAAAKCPTCGIDMPHFPATSD